MEGKKEAAKKAVSKGRSKKAEKVKPEKKGIESIKMRQVSKVVTKPEELKAKSFLEAVDIALKNSKKRNFDQTWELIIGTKNLNLKSPENRFNVEFSLPEGRGKAVKVAVIADALITEAKKYADLAIAKADIESLQKDKKKLKEIIDSHDFFYAEASLMVSVARFLGPMLGPRGKMAKPIPPGVKVESIIQKAKSLVKISLKESPVMQVIVGKESMEPEKVAKNAEAVHHFILEKLPKGKDNIKSIYLKTTMGRPVRVMV